LEIDSAIAISADHHPPRSTTDLAVVDEFALDVAFEADLDPLSAIGTVDLE